LPPGYDLYIDCTGLSRRFIKDDTIITDENHLVDTAVVCQFELDNEPAYTQTIARKYGWQFIVNLTNRIGSGYIYSSKHISDEDALLEYKEMTKHRVPYMNKTPKVFKWKPGYLANPWTDNVVAVGLSSGMLDPLEANVLFMTQLGIQMIVKCIQRGYDQRTYNRMMRNVWKDNSDFILHHYMLTSRDDTSFWKHYADCDVRESLWQHYESKKDIHTNLYPDAIWANLGVYYDEFTFYKKREKIDAT
jgi:tryptophan halogenase